MSENEELELNYFDYRLPENRIGQVPRSPRDSARMLVSAGSKVEHSRVRDLGQYFTKGDVLVLNDTKVRHARVKLQKATGGQVEVLLLGPELARADQGNIWRAMIKPSKRVPHGAELFVDGNLEPVVVALDGDEQSRFVEVLNPEVLEIKGQVPLPPYITQTLDDPSRYQTVYANRVASAAAPTAGLHLTDELLDSLRGLGVEVCTVELEVGIGTFRPISSERIVDHKMHAERYSISGEVAAAIERAKSEGRRITAVGTTVVRTLESYGVSGNLQDATELYIRRGFEWSYVDRLMTNFHVPKSSLLVMIDAFVGPIWKYIYGEAVNYQSEDPYQFLSFGDCMLLERVSEPIE